jgi:Fanconi anemia group M protein
MKLGHPLEFKQLPVADYIINDIAVERKTIQDFKASIKNKRLPQQLIELKQYKHHLLILEGYEESDPYNTPGLHENAMRGFMHSVLLEFETPILITLNAKDTAKHLSVIARKQTKSEISIRPSKISLSKPEQQQFILEGFPNIGPTKAKALLKKFQSLENIFKASEEELAEILGKQAEEFKALLS